MAEFGAPYSAQNHHLLGVLAALAMQKRMAERESPWKLRIGLASGTSLVGLVGSESRKNYTAIGDAVNLASRLQEMCPPGSVCVDEAVHQAVKRWFLVRRIRVGLTAEEAKDLEARLEFLDQAIEHAPTAKMCLEAADICSELGNMPKAVAFHRRALELDPSKRRPVERAVAATILTGEERARINIKGKKERVAVYEVQGLKIPWTDRVRLPEKAGHIFKWMESELELPEEWLLSIEALEGRVGHGRVVGALAGALADSMGLDEDKIKAAFLAGYFNDVGKKNVPEHLLCYQGRMPDLPQPDQALIQNHSIEAEKVLREMGFPLPPEAVRAIAEHHERFDGRGYPSGLKGEDISLLARVVRIADTYEAMTAWRTYREALTPDAALIELRRDIETGAVDPKIGEVFFKLMEGRQSAST